MKRIYKVYNDGGAFIGIRKTESNSAPRRKPVPEEPVVVKYDSETEGNAAAPVHDEGYENMIDPVLCGNECVKVRVATLTEEFKRFYRQTVGMRWKKRRQYVTDKMRPYFDDEDDLQYFISRKMHNAYRASMARLNRCKRRVALHGLDWFCTFTYDDKKMTEEQFSKKLLNTLRHFASRKGWKYMGAWERGEKGRLHFHALLNIPEGTMSGTIEKRREYDPVRKKMVACNINTFFEKTFGRNTFDKLSSLAMRYSKTAEYIVKYLEKDGGRLICSRGLDTFIETQIDEEDIITALHPDEPYDDRKYILFDDFKVWDKNGKCLGTFNRSLLPLLKLVS
jgi:hypothetical protein